jgi:hypothetical protein
VRNLAPKQLTIGVSFLVEGSNGKITNTALSTMMRNRLKKTSVRHYRNTLTQFSNIFGRSGVLSGTHGGHRAVSFKNGEGKAGKIVTTKWQPLTPAYVRRKPRSTRVWQKRGLGSGLAKHYDTDIQPKRLGVSVRRTAIERSHHRNRVRAIYKIKFDQLPNDVVNRLIAAPFVNGSETPARGFKAFELDRNSSALMGYPEKAQRRGRKGGTSARPVNRPFIARLSARLGRDMHTAIRKL